MATLYRTHRPQRFSDVVGQDHICQTLQAALAQGRLGHAYLFAGPRGTGKTTVARLLAKAINCQNQKTENRKPKTEESDQSIQAGAVEPCNQCQLCLEITDGRALDVLEIDAASNRGIDEIRELRDKIRFAPTQAVKKVYIIDEVHMLTKEAFNALLKTLEEPPTHAVFILATTELHKVPVTIASRCQVFIFKKATTQHLHGRLRWIADQEGLTIDDPALGLLIRLAGGSYRDAISLLDQIASYADGPITLAVVQDILGLATEDRLLALFEAVTGGDRPAVLQLLASFEEGGIDLDYLTGQLLDCVRYLLHLRLQVPLATGVISGDQTDAWQQLAAIWDESALMKLAESLVTARQLQKHTQIALLPLEMAMMKAMLERMDQKSEVRSQKSEEPEDEPAKEQKNKRTNEQIDQQGPEIIKPEESVREARGVQDAQEASSKIDKSEVVSEKSLPVELWPQILAQTKGLNAGLHAILQQAELVKLTKTTLHIDVSFQFALDRLNEPKYRTQLEGLVAQLAGRSLALEVALCPRPHVTHHESDGDHSPEVLAAAADVFGFEEAVA